MDDSLLEDYFDPHKLQHLRAYKHLTQNGAWPDWFIQELNDNKVTITVNSILEIAFKIAYYYINEVCQFESSIKI